MFTTIILIVVIFAVCYHFSKKPDKKSAKKQAEDAVKIANLPDINIVGHELTSAQKAMELWPSDSDVLYVLRYERDSQLVYLQLRDGRYIYCQLNQLDVLFDRIKTKIRVVCSCGNAKFSFYEYKYVFTDEEWNTIYYVLSLAGVTHNISTISSSSRFAAQFNEINNILRKF